MSSVEFTPVAQFGPWERRGLWLLIVLPILPGAGLWLLHGLIPDEAYYWVWGQRPQWGYFDHAPGVAWLIWLSTLLWDAAWTVRLPAVVGWLVTAWCVHDMTLRVFKARSAALLALAAWSTLPIAQVGLHTVTPDSPLVAFTALAYWGALRALQAEGGEARRWWLVTGACTGAALLSKYTAALLPGVLLLALLTSRDGRRALATPWPWLGVLLAVALFSPVLIWNALNGWASFAFQLGHGVQAANPEPLRSLLTFLAGQLGVALPWTWIGLLLAGVGAFRSATPAAPSVRMLLGWGFVLPLGVFSLAALTSAGEANWAVIAYIPGSVLLGGLLARAYGGRGRWGRGLWWGGWVTTVLLATLLVNVLRFPGAVAALGVALPSQRTQLTYAYGWAEAARRVRALEGDTECLLLAGSYQNASMLAWYLGRPRGVGVSSTARFSQYNLWQSAPAAGDSAADRTSTEEPCFYVTWYRSPAQMPDAWTPPVRTPLLAAPLLAAPWPRVEAWRSENPDRTVRWLAIYRNPRRPRP